MKAKAIQTFHDKKEGVTRKVGDTFTLSKERFQQINSTKLGVMAEAVAEESAPPKRKPAKKEG